MTRTEETFTVRISTIVVVGALAVAATGKPGYAEFVRECIATRPSNANIRAVSGAPR